MLYAKDYKKVFSACDEKDFLHTISSVTSRIYYEQVTDLSQIAVHESGPLAGSTLTGNRKYTKSGFARLLKLIAPYSLIFLEGIAGHRRMSDMPTGMCSKEEAFRIFNRIAALRYQLLTRKCNQMRLVDNLICYFCDSVQIVLPHELIFSEVKKRQSSLVFDQSCLEDSRLFLNLYFSDRTFKVGNDVYNIGWFIQSNAFSTYCQGLNVFRRQRDGVRISSHSGKVRKQSEKANTAGQSRELYLRKCLNNLESTVLDTKRFAEKMLAAEKEVIGDWKKVCKKLRYRVYSSMYPINPKHVCRILDKLKAEFGKDITLSNLIETLADYSKTLAGSARIGVEKLIHSCLFNLE